MWMIIINYNVIALELNKHIPKQFCGNKNITNIYRIKAYDSIIYWYLFIVFIDFTLKRRSFLDCTNLTSRRDYKKNDKITLKYFQWLKRWKNYIALFAISYVLEKTAIISIICSKCKNEDEKIFKEKESIVILKIPDLIENI